MFSHCLSGKEEVLVEMQFDCLNLNLVDILEKWMSLLWYNSSYGWIYLPTYVYLLELFSVSLPHEEMDKMLNKELPPK